MNQTNDDKNGYKDVIFFVAISALILGLWICWGYLGVDFFFRGKNLQELNNAGIFGDSFGVLTAAFAGLSLIGVYYAVWLQRKELAAATKEFKQQNDTLKLQRFESTFFNMLSQHNELVSAFSGYDSSGREAFGKGMLKVIYKQLLKNLNTNTMENGIGKINIACDSVYVSLPETAPYLRSLSVVLTFISQANEDAQSTYAEFIRAQLNQYETSLLFFYGLSDKGNTLKPLIERYGLLANLAQGESESIYIHPLRSQYTDKAYNQVLDCI